MSLLSSCTFRVTGPGGCGHRVPRSLELLAGVAATWMLKILGFGVVWSFGRFVTGRAVPELRKLTLPAVSLLSGLREERNNTDSERMGEWS
jgi:hypothetical protein